MGRGRNAMTEKRKGNRDEIMDAGAGERGITEVTGFVSV